MKRQVAQALLQIGAVGFSPQAPVTFKSGIVSPVYVDNRRLPYHPENWWTIIEGFRTVAQTLHYDVLAGIAVGGIPHSAALGFALQRPSVFVRKEAKEHGKQQRIEGGDVEGKCVLLIEDLVTTGGSSLSGVAALQAAGAMVQDVIAIVSYGFEEAQQAFDEANITLHTLTDFSMILEEAMILGMFTADERHMIEDWFNDPHHWASRHKFV